MCDYFRLNYSSFIKYNNITHSIISDDFLVSVIVPNVIGYNYIAHSIISDDFLVSVIVPNVIAPPGSDVIAPPGSGHTSTSLFTSIY